MSLKILNEKNPKDPFESRKERSAIKNYRARKLLWRTKAFKRFCQKEGDRVKEELEARRRKIAQKPEHERTEIDQMWLGWPFEKALDEALKGEFIRTFEGKQVSAALKVGEWVQLPIAYSRELFADKYLTLSINLTFSKQQIREQFEHILKEMHARVKRPQPPQRGDAIMEPADIDRIFRAFDLVEERGLLQACWEIFPETRNLKLHEHDDALSKYSQIRYWHGQIKKDLEDVNKLEDAVP